VRSRRRPPARRGSATAAALGIGVALVAAAAAVIGSIIAVSRNPNPAGRASLRAADAHANGGHRRMDVDVDIFSGRVNPRFTLAADTAAELTHRLAALPPALGPERPPGDLGYRGLRVSRHGGDPGDTRDTITEVTVSRGEVAVRAADGSRRRLLDPGRALERWLLDIGASELDPAVLATARHDLPPPSTPPPGPATPT
jgi:hypothetical protein